MIVFYCFKCGTRLEVADEYAGKIGTCRSCKSSIKVPSESVESTQPVSGSIELPEPPIPASGTNVNMQDDNEAVREAGLRKIDALNAMLQGTLPPSVPIVQDYKPIPPPVFERDTPHVTQRHTGSPICIHCGGAMKKKRITQPVGCAFGIICVLIGVSLCFTVVGAIFGIPLIILGLLMGDKKVWKCRNCGAVVDRS